MKRLGFEGLRLKDILVNGGCAHRREDMPAAQRERCVISPKHRRGESIAHGVITLSVNTPSPTALSVLIIQNELYRCRSDHSLH